MEDWNLAMRLGSLNRESNVMLAGALSGQEFDLESGRCIVETEWIDDGYTWNPTITNVAYTVTSGESIDDHVIVVSEVLGTELHFLTNWQVEARYIGGEEDSGNIITNKLNTSIPLYNRVIFDTNSLELDELPTELILIGEGGGFKKSQTLDRVEYQHG